MFWRSHRHWGCIVYLQNGESFCNFPTAGPDECKEILFCPLYTEIAIFSCILTKLPPYVTVTMPGVKHPVGAPQLGISWIVLDIFRFHQSKWLQFSIKMLNLGQGLRELGRKCDAVSIDDKWPSFHSVNREIRAGVTCPAGFIFYE